MNRVIPVNEIKVTPLDRCLAEWARYQGRNEDRGDYRYKDSVCKGEGALDFEQLTDQVDNNVAMAVDAMVNSLPHHYRWAICIRVGLATAWKFAQLQYDKTLGEAEAELIIKLKRNSTTSNFFIA